MGLLDKLLSPAASLIGGWLGYKGQKDANEQNIALSREQMGFQERMSNTAWQRGVADMQAAGLSPMLAYSQGGASQPQGSMATTQNEMGAGVSSAAQGAAAAATIQSIQQSKSQTELIKAQADKTKSETIEHSINNARAVAEMKDWEWKQQRTGEEAGSAYYDRLSKSKKYRAESEDKGGDAWQADVRRRKAEASLAELDVPKSQAQSDMFKSDFGKNLPYLKPILDLIRGYSAWTWRR